MDRCSSRMTARSRSGVSATRGSKAALRGIIPRLALVAACCVAAMQAPRAQDDASAAAVASARHILELLKLEKFEDVAKDFTPQMTAAMSAKQLGDLWSSLHGRVGTLTSIIDGSAASAGGI